MRNRHRRQTFVRPRLTKKRWRKDKETGNYTSEHLLSNPLFQGLPSPAPMAPPLTN
jgi:hypothetical protein